MALPQYKVAVEKSRIAQVISTLRSIQQAEEVYYLANGEYTKNKEELDITLPASPKEWTFMLMQNGSLTVEAQRYDPGISITAFFEHYEDRPGALVCWADNRYDLAQRICKAVGREKTTNRGGGTRWLIY